MTLSSFIRLPGIHFDPTPEPPAPAPAPAPAPEPAPAPAPDPNAKTLSQADVDRIVQERLARDRRDRPSEDELKELRAAQKRLEEIEESNKTELQKAQDRATELERERDAARTAAQETTLRSAIIAEAVKKGFADPSDAVSMIDRATLEIDGDGNPKNIGDVMDALLTAKPYLAGGGNDGRGAGNGNADQGARTDGSKQLASTEGMTAEQIATAVAEGRLDEYLKTKK